MISRRQLLLGAAVALAMPRARAHIGPRGSVSSGVNPMGTNYAAGGASALSYESLPMFKNRVREGRGFTETGSLETQVSLTSAGWPAGDFACVLWEGANVPEWASAATSGNPMKCYFIGTGSETVALTSLNGCTIANIVHGTGGAYTTFEIYNITGDFGFQVTGTTGGVTDVAAYPPGYDLGGIDDVTQESAYWPASLTIYGALAGITNAWLSNVFYNTGENTSTTRRTPSNMQARQIVSGNQGQNVVCEGYPAEWLAYFCKYCGPNVAAYFCLPVWEDGTNGQAGTYSNALLTMVNDVLIPNGNKVILEIGREIWNSANYPIGVGSGQTLNTLAVNSGIASSDTDYAGCYKYVGYRMHALANMCRSIFGSAFGTQVKLVIGSQTGGNGYGTYFPAALSYMSSNYGNPGADVQYLALAPYVNLADNAGDTSVALVLSDLGTVGETQPYVSTSEHGWFLAGRYGMQLIAYEGGWQVNSEASGNAYIASAIMNSGMEAVMRDQVWKPMLDAGYALIFNFESGVPGGGAAYNPVDEWATDYSTFVSSGSPRYNALIDLAGGSYVPQRNVLTARGQTFEGSASFDNTTGSAVGCTDGYGSLLSDAWGIKIYVPAGLAGSYTPTVNVTGSASSATIESNGSTIQTTALSAGNNVLDAITLKAGFNYLLIYNGSGVSAVNSVQLN
jgi:hypothetical protein